jgi:two-component system, sensor histidine kinase PdtaS
VLHTVTWPAAAAPAPTPDRLSFRIARWQAGWARWLLAVALWLAAASARWLLDGFVDCGPFLTFLPALALTTVFCGRAQALAVIGLASAVAAWLWLPPADVVLADAALQWPTTPISLALFVAVGLFELTLVDLLYRNARDHAERQRRLESALRLREIMMREMRHRLANQLHLITAALEGAQIKIAYGAEGRHVLERAIARVSSITGLQRIIDGKASSQRELAPLLREVLDHVFHDVDVAVQVRAAPVPLPDHHVTMICLIVIEAAMNSAKHIFRRRRGCMFAVELCCTADGRLVLTIWDDGPEFDADSVMANSAGLGLSIMQELAAELGGSLSLDGHSGTAVNVEFARA